MAKRNLRVLKSFAELTADVKVKTVILHYKNINSKKHKSKKSFTDEMEARRYFEENKLKKNLVLTKQL